jgi:hypothetical protein
LRKLSLPLAEFRILNSNHRLPCEINWSPQILLESPVEQKLQKKMRKLRWRTQNRLEKAIWGKRFKSRKKQEKEFDRLIKQRKK